MLLVTEVEPGTYELVYMWLPTWLGMNTKLKKQVESYIADKFVGTPAAPEELHRAVIDFFCKQFPEVRGLREYLEAIEHVVGPEDEHGYQG